MFVETSGIRGMLLVLVRVDHCFPLGSYSNLATPHAAIRQGLRAGRSGRKLLLEIYKRTTFPTYLGLGFKVVIRGV